MPSCILCLVTAFRLVQFSSILFGCCVQPQPFSYILFSGCVQNRAPPVYFIWWLRSESCPSRLFCLVAAFRIGPLPSILFGGCVQARVPLVYFAWWLRSGPCPYRLPCLVAAFRPGPSHLFCLVAVFRLVPLSSIVFGVWVQTPACLVAAFIPVPRSSILDNIGFFSLLTGFLSELRTLKQRRGICQIRIRSASHTDNIYTSPVGEIVFSCSCNPLRRATPRAVCREPGSAFIAFKNMRWAAADQEISAAWTVCQRRGAGTPFKQHLTSFVPIYIAFLNQCNIFCWFFCIMFSHTQLWNSIRARDLFYYSSV